MLAPFDICVPGDAMAVRDALMAVIAGLGPLRLDADEVGTVELVLAEALNNIVEHAYPVGVPAGPIRVTCQHRNEGLHFTIRDSGNEMPGGLMPRGAAQDLNVDLLDMPEGGFGWCMIHGLAKDVSYARLDRQNELRLRLAVAVRGSR